MTDTPDIPADDRWHQLRGMARDRLRAGMEAAANEAERLNAYLDYTRHLEAIRVAERRAYDRQRAGLAVDLDDVIARVFGAGPGAR